MGTVIQRESARDHTALGVGGHRRSAGSAGESPAGTLGRKEKRDQRHPLVIPIFRVNDGLPALDYIVDSALPSQ